MNATTSPKLNPNVIPNPNLKTNSNSTRKSEDLNMVVLSF